ncbi:single-stranded DNA-binding protein [Patescibacteria group bacterium]|nr:single-stranded DNA-binding protein [Patescibacteria group bacterium]
MRDLNKTMLIGNLTRDPEVRTIPSGQSVASFAIATNRSWNDNAGQVQKAVEFTDIVAWGKLAEIAGQILKKGRRTYIEGRLQTRNWEGQDGIKRYKTEVIASDIIALDSRPASVGFESSETPNQNYASAPMSSENQAVKQEVGVGAAAPASSAPSTDSEIDIEDIPF